MTSPQQARVPFKPGDVIKDRYTLLRQIGAGTYGAIFAAVYRGNAVSRLAAIKLEKETQKYTLQYNEVNVMKALAGSSHFAKFFRCGTHDGFKFVCMELLGPSLIQLVNRNRPYSLTLFQLLKTGIQAIKILQELHRAGFIHRDVKPENFVIGNTKNTSGTLYLIDFGLCKPILMEDGKIVRPANQGNLRGTLRYASPNGHKLVELGRHDDLISLLYMMVDCYMRKLPWSNTENPDNILQLKEQSRGGILLQNMPPEFQEFENHIFSLNYEDEPNYKKLIGLLSLVGYNNRFDLNNWPFEWEEELNQQRSIVHQRQLNGKSEFKLIENQDQQINMNMNTINEEQQQNQRQIQPIENITIQDQYNFELTNLSLISEITMKNMNIMKQKQKQNIPKQKQDLIQKIPIEQIHLPQNQLQIKQNNEQLWKQKDLQLQQIQQQKIKQQQNSNIDTILQIAKQPEQPEQQQHQLIINKQQSQNEQKIEQDQNEQKEEQQQSKEQQFIHSQYKDNLQIKRPIPHIENYSPFSIYEPNNISSNNNQNSTTDQEQNIVIQESGIKETSFESHKQNQIQNYILKSISQIQISKPIIEQEQQIIASDNKVDQHHKSESLQVLNSKQSDMPTDNNNPSHYRSFTQTQFDAQEQTINLNDKNKQQDSTTNQRQISPKQQKQSPKSSLIIVQYEQIPTEEQQLMLKPANPVSQYSTNSTQSQNFSNYYKTQESSQILSTKSSQKSSQAFLTTFNSLNELNQLSPTAQQQHSPIVDQKQKEYNEINQQQQNNNLFQKFGQSSEQTHILNKPSINSIKRSQSNNDMQSLKLNGQKTTVLSPPKRFLLFDSNLQPKPLQVKIHESLSKQQSPKLRVTSPSGSQKSDLSIVINSPFSTKSSQRSTMSPVSVGPQAASTFKNISPLTTDNVSNQNKEQNVTFFDPAQEQQQDNEKNNNTQVLKDKEIITKQQEDINQQQQQFDDISIEKQKKNQQKLIIQYVTPQPQNEQNKPSNQKSAHFPYLFQPPFLSSVHPPKSPTNFTQQSSDNAFQSLSNSIQNSNVFVSQEDLQQPIFNHLGLGPIMYHSSDNLDRYADEDLFIRNNSPSSNILRQQDSKLQFEEPQILVISGTQDSSSSEHSSCESSNDIKPIFQIGHKHPIKEHYRSYSLVVMPNQKYQQKQSQLNIIEYKQHSNVEQQQLQQQQLQQQQLQQQLLQQQYQQLNNEGLRKGLKSIEGSSKLEKDIQIIGKVQLLNNQSDSVFTSASKTSQNEISNQNILQTSNSEQSGQSDKNQQIEKEQNNKDEQVDEQIKPSQDSNHFKDSDYDSKQ